MPGELRTPMSPLRGADPSEENALQEGLMRAARIVIVVGLFLSSGILSIAQYRPEPTKGSHDDVPETCPTTKPYQASLFVPPSPYPAKAPSGTFWFGTDRLWTGLAVNGAWRGLPHYTPSDPTFRQKLFFYRQGYDWHTEPQPNLTVTGKRLDAPAPPLLSDRANNGWVRPEQPFIVTGINFPTLGCWEITAHYKDDELTFVVWVAP